MKRWKIKQQGLLTQKELENGIWQFCLDHGHCLDGEIWQIKFPVKSKQQLISRIYSRASLMYKIKDEENIDKEIQQAITKYMGQKEMLKRYTDRIAAIEKLPPFKRKVIKTATAIIKKLTDKWIK